MTRYISAGIDIGSHTMRVAVVENKKTGGFKIIGKGQAPSEGIRQGYIVNKKDAGESIRAAVAMAEKSSGVKIKSALVAIGGIGLESERSVGSVIISRVDGEVTRADVEKAIANAEEATHTTNKKIIHRFALSYKIDGQVLLGEPEGMHGRKLDVETLFIMCFNQHLDNLVDTVERYAGIEVEDVVAAPLAASIVTLNKAQRTAGCVLANIGAETVSLGVFEDDFLISLAVIPLGSRDITHDIALGLRVPLDEAEELKVRRMSQKDYSQKKLDEIIEARLRDIFDVIGAHLKSLGKNELLPAGVVIIGGGSGITAIENLARTSLRLPARVMVPEVVHYGDESGEDAAWSVAYGLCLLSVNDTYQSDLSGFDSGRSISKGLRGVFDWFKQFSP
ncbi:MAG: cell division protein FtsA [Candidatus Paceibacterota bacterium]